MAKQTINIGSAANDGTGTNLRAGGTMINENFTEVYAGVAAAAEPFNWSPQVDDPIHTPAELVESMHSAFGYNHCRAVHAKGIILQGEFTPDTHAKEITKAPHLQGPGSKVTVRFSDFSGVPTIPDNDLMANPRGMAIRFEFPGGASTDVAAHSFNGFPVSNTDDLRELMLAIAASGPCAATPTALDRFLEFHPTARAFLATQETPASFASISFPATEFRSLSDNPLYKGLMISGLILVPATPIIASRLP